MVSDVELRDPGTDRSDDSRDFMAQNRRRWNNVVSCEEQIGMTQPGGLNIDQNFATHRLGDVDLFDVESTPERIKD